MEIRCESWGELLTLLDEKLSQEPLQLEWVDRPVDRDMCVKHTGDNPCTWIMSLAALAESRSDISPGVQALFARPEGRALMAEYLHLGSLNLLEKADLS